MQRTYVWPLLFALLGGVFPVCAQDTVTIPRASRAPVLDEYVAGVPSDAGVEISGFRQFAPGDGDPVSRETRAYLSYDDTHLYVVFVCKDDPKLVRARIARRDDVFGDDGVQLFLDTFHDKQRAFVFTANPYGAQMDSRLTEGLGYDFDFDTQWTSDGRITSDGYVVTMQIPFKSLRFEKGPAQNWGIAVNRIIPHTNEFTYWPYITERKEGLVPQFAEARIEDTIAPGRNIQVIPHITYRDTRALEFDGQGTPSIGRTQRTEVGVDAKVVIRDSLAVDLTVNPDFGEVESDEPQVIVNKRFEVFFPEKRPFFLENAGFFGTPVSLFSSRRIVDPQYGARITGRVGRWAVGGLLIDDEAAGNFLTGDDAGETGQIGVARVQRDFGKQSNVGVMLTDRRVGDQSNRVFGLDTRIKLNDNWTLAGQAVGSKSVEVDDFHRDGHLFFAQATRAGRHFTYDGQLIDISRDFETELGFVPRTDIRQLYQTSAYLWQFPEAPWLISAGPELTVVHTWDQDNQLQDWSVDTGFAVNGLRQTKFEGVWSESYELFAGHEFRKHGYSLSASTEWVSWLTGGVKLTVGDGVNYIPAAGLEPFLGDARQVAIEFTYSPFAQLRVDQDFIWDELRTRSPIAGRGDGASIFRNTLSRTKIKYQFSRFLAAHVIFNYEALEPDTGLIALERDRSLTADVLLSYSPNPGTALYLGYTDQQENVRLFGDPRVLEPTRDLDLHTGKQFFFKLSYLFNY
jgi:hypothetical protein